MQIEEEEKAKFLLPLVWIGHKTDIKRLLFLNPENEELKLKRRLTKNYKRTQLNQTQRESFGVGN